MGWLLEPMKISAHYIFSNSALVYSVDEISLSISLNSIRLLALRLRLRFSVCSEWWCSFPENDSCIDENGEPSPFSLHLY
ncbi:unnamed protein product [Arabidopsis lyrata]|nr:unnamed protein product [Arabidopsis lyrata]